MKTLRQLKAWAKENKLEFNSCCNEYALLSKDDFLTSSVFSFYECESPFCCGVHDFGDFCFSDEAFAGKTSIEHCENLIQFYILETQRKYYRCTTLSSDPYENLNTALANLKFRLILKLNSKDSPKHEIFLWEYLEC